MIGSFLETRSVEGYVRNAGATRRAREQTLPLLAEGQQAAANSSSLEEDVDVIRPGWRQRQRSRAGACQSEGEMAFCWLLAGWACGCLR